MNRSRAPAERSGPSRTGAEDFEFPLDAATWAAVQAELRLAPQLVRVVEQLLVAKRDKQIALELGIAEPTVRTYLTRIFSQLGATDRMEVVLRVVTLAWRLRQPHPCPRQ